MTVEIKYNFGLTLIEIYLIMKQIDGEATISDNVFVKIITKNIHNLKICM